MFKCSHADVEWARILSHNSLPLHRRPEGGYMHAATFSPATKNGVFLIAIMCNALLRRRAADDNAITQIW